MGSWLVEVEGPAGVWMLVYDGRDHAFVTRRESAPGVWEVIWTDTDAGAFARSLRRVVDRARR